MSRVCKDCQYIKRHVRRADEHPNWKGGHQIRPDGYISIQLQPSDPYYRMANERGCVLEHRLTVARTVGRCLLSEEVVHHINGNKSDNRIENLELLPNLASHLPYIILQIQVGDLKRQIDKQNEQIRLLQWRVRELEHGNPELAEGASSRASVETLQEAPQNRG